MSGVVGRLAGPEARGVSLTGTVTLLSISDCGLGQGARSASVRPISASPTAKGRRRLALGGPKQASRRSNAKEKRKIDYI